jgi:hypothetical protein
MSGFTEVLLYANDGLYDLRGVPDDADTIDLDLVVDEFKGLFDGEPDKAEIRLRRHNHDIAKHCRCSLEQVLGEPLWSNGVQEAWTDE